MIVSMEDREMNYIDRVVYFDYHGVRYQGRIVETMTAQWHPHRCTLVIRIEDGPFHERLTRKFGDTIELPADYEDMEIVWSNA
jgi:hypothetical protein